MFEAPYKTSPVGLVLSGGGAKGAFQVGVLKALQEDGYLDKLKVISGTSVGAINGVMLASRIGIDKLEKYYLDNIEDIPTTSVDHLLDAGLKFFNYLFDDSDEERPGFLDRSRLETILLNLVPRRWAADSPILYASSLNTNRKLSGSDGRYQLTRFKINEEGDHIQRIRKILASAAIPWAFKPVRIDGNDYVDGGWNERGGDNIPVAPILERHPEIKNIIIIHCNSRTILWKYKIPRDVRIMEFYPDAPLPGIFDCYTEMFPFEIERLQKFSATLAFSVEYAKDYICRGYEVAKKILGRSFIESSALRW